MPPESPTVITRNTAVEQITNTESESYTPGNTPSTSRRTWSWKIWGYVQWEAGSARQRLTKNDSSPIGFPVDITATPQKKKNTCKQLTGAPAVGTTPHTRTHTMAKELTYTVNEFVPPRVKFLPKAAPLYRALLPFAQTRHFLSAPPVGAHILLGASLRARHRWFLF